MFRLHYTVLWKSFQWIHVLQYYGLTFLLLRGLRDHRSHFSNPFSFLKYKKYCLSCENKQSKVWLRSIRSFRITKLLKELGIQDWRRTIANKRMRSWYSSHDYIELLQERLRENETEHVDHTKNETLPTESKQKKLEGNNLSSWFSNYITIEKSLIYSIIFLIGNC